MSRTNHITICGVEIAIDRQQGLRTPTNERPLLFRPIQFRGVTIRNRIVLPPMSQYLAADGVPTDWQLVHLGQFAMGGAGIVFGEETAVEAQGRRTHQCAGIYNDAQVAGWRRITEFLKDLGATPGMQLGHAGRRGSHRSPYDRERPLSDKNSARHLAPWPTVSASALPYAPNRPIPTALDHNGIKRQIASWRDAARRSVDAGFDILEIHGAHGYLIHQFLSPLSNKRTDAYGGDLQGRMRFALELTEAVRDAWPQDKPLFFRVSAVDGRGGYWDIEDTVALVRELKVRGVDVIDCSAGGMLGPSPMPALPRVPGHYVPYAEYIRREADVPTVGLGMITDPHQAESILQEQRADLVGLGLEMMRNPYWPVAAARALGLSDWIEVLPPPYAARLDMAWKEQELWDQNATHDVPFRRSSAG